ncbi:MAG: class F sortase [Dehalococcoidia bacterium]|nr:class F sortase [Dehalococcoidia bacterium]
MMRRLMPRLRLWVGCSRLTSRLVAVLAVPVCAVTVLAACDSGPDIVVTAPTATEATATSTPSRTPTRTPTPQATPTEVEEPRGQVIQSLRDLVADYGYPDGADFARLRIPTLSVDSQVSARYVGQDGVMPNPVGPADVAWYNMDDWNGMGGAPGGGGNAIFSGHVDYAANVHYAGVYYRGQGVFSQLRLLSEGDIIEVDYNGQTLRYAVVWRQQLGAKDASWGAIWSNDVPVDSITLYTCGGEFDFDSREYADRVVVRAERIS